MSAHPLSMRYREIGYRCHIRCRGLFPGRQKDPEPVELGFFHELARLDLIPPEGVPLVEINNPIRLVVLAQP